MRIMIGEEKGGRIVDWGSPEVEADLVQITEGDGSGAGGVRGGSGLRGRGI